MYILIFKFLDSKQEDKNSAPNDSKHSLTSLYINYQLYALIIIYS